MDRVCFALTIFLLAVLAMGSSTADTLVVDDEPGRWAHYDSIGSAFENSTSGDIIRIFEGTYTEHIIINRSVSIIGNGSSSTELSAPKSRHGIHITADNTSIENITIRHQQYLSHYAGVFLDDVNDCRISNSDLINHNQALRIWNCTRTTLDNIFIRSGLTGISMYGGSNNTIKDSYIMMANAVSAFAVSDLVIENNHIDVAEDNGLVLSYCMRPVVTGNRMTSVQGIRLFGTEDAMVANNDMDNGGIVIGGDEPGDWDSHSVSGNSVGGKAVSYITKTDGGSIPSGSGQAIVAGSRNINVTGLNITNATSGILIGFSDLIDVDGCRIVFEGTAGMYIAYSTNVKIGDSYVRGFAEGIGLIHSNDVDVRDSEFASNFQGISLYRSHNNSLIGNRIIDNVYGIESVSSRMNLFRENEISDNAYGLDLRNSNFNDIQGNIFSSNDLRGINLVESRNNSIHHNRFRFNGRTSQALDDTGENQWHDGEEGNFWSDYEHHDIDGDGIGEEPYAIAGSDQVDPYPIGYFREISNERTEEQEIWSLIVIVYCAVIILAVILYTRPEK